MLLLALVAVFVTVTRVVAVAPSGRSCGNSTVKQGHRNILYVTNWGIYGAGYNPDDIPVEEISHVLYAFADILPNGTVASSDPWADTGKPFGNDSTNEPGNNAYGLVKQLYLKKMANRNMKVILSIGGYTFSPKFAPVAADDARRANFVSSAVKLVADWGMDGIDLDWEYPNTTETNINCVKMLTELRKGLDDYSAKHAEGYHFALGFAAPAGPQNYRAFNLKAMDESLDFWSLMAFDFAGPWDNTTGHQSNVFGNKANPMSTKASIERAIKDYANGGVAPGKINLGMPLYGRAFSKTRGLGEPYCGVPNGTLGQPGILLYKDLPRPRSKVHFDNEAKATYSYDNTTGELVSFDNMKSAKYKQAYIKKKKLGGAMFWEATGDKIGRESLVRKMAAGLGGLEKSPNLLSYPVSQYDNIRNGMKSNLTSIPETNRSSEGR
ncbi:Putative glycoside hydrolase family 18, catalytic domain, glycosyl hydrolase family 18 (GH18) active [Colletotrichum destructivum]|uniref:chitinase n=1 Tax=Colletotrichum destructivum TaxID=34406 RepID=A0AAX4IGD9_9PEZI|nr:Putative glycoside hydrolase family 18, catalytic domain, glycosyl hydrolase family 18 (GH18) active [Colletotrichum destructivum]